MKHSLIFMTIWSFLLFALSSVASGAFGSYADFYVFTIPFVIASFGCFVLSACGLLIKTKRRAIFIFSLILFALLVVPHSYALLQWPPDDDGPGILWSFVLGGGVFLAFLFAFFVLLHYLAKKLHVKQL